MPSYLCEIFIFTPYIVLVKMILLVDEDLNANWSLLWSKEELIFHVQATFCCYIVFKSLIEAIYKLKVTLNIFSCNFRSRLVWVTSFIGNIAYHLYCENSRPCFLVGSSWYDFFTVLRQQVIILLKFGKKTTSLIRVFQLLYEILLHKSLCFFII